VVQPSEPREGRVGHASRPSWEDHCSVHEHTVPPSGPAKLHLAHLTNLAQTTKLTLDSREDFVVDLSSELVEKDL
jgi:hypothetical protein